MSHRPRSPWHQLHSPGRLSSSDVDISYVYNSKIKLVQLNICTKKRKLDHYYSSRVDYRSPHDLEGISLSQTHPLSLPCVHAIHVSLSTFVPCWPDLYWTCAIGVSLSVANNHTLAIFVYLLASLFYLGDACVICSHKKRKNTLSL